MRKIVGLAALSISMACGSARAQNSAVNGYCQLGATSAAVSGLNSTNKLQGIIPKCTVSVFLTGTTNLATIFSTAGGGTLSNPFTANATTGQWLFYASSSAAYDIVMSGGTSSNVYPAPVTLTGVASGSGTAPVIPFGGAPGISFALTSTTSRLATSGDLSTLGAIVSGGACGGALSGTFPNCTIAGIGASGTIPKSNGSGDLIQAVSGTDYAPGTNPSGGQNNYAPLNDPSFTGGVVSTFSDTPIFGFNTSAASGTQISGLSGDCPNLVAGINSACALAVGITGTLNNFGALYFRYTGLGSASNYMEMSLAAATSMSPKMGICSDGNGNAAVNNSMSNAICGDGTHTLLVNGTVAATSYNGAAITSSGSGTNFLNDLGTYIPITAAGVPVDVTGSRTFGPGNIYQNTNAYTLQASGFGVAVTGTATNNIACLIGPTSPPTMIVFSETNGATTIGGAAGFICPRIPATWFYEVNKTNDLSATPSSWIESPTI